MIGIRIQVIMVMSLAPYHWAIPLFGGSNQLELCSVLVLAEPTAIISHDPTLKPWMIQPSDPTILSCNCMYSMIIGGATQEIQYFRTRKSKQATPVLSLLITLTSGYGPLPISMSSQQVFGSICLRPNWLSSSVQHTLLCLWTSTYNLY